MHHINLRFMCTIGVVQRLISRVCGTSFTGGIHGGVTGGDSMGLKLKCQFYMIGFCIDLGLLLIDHADFCFKAAPPINTCQIHPSRKSA